MKKNRCLTLFLAMLIMAECSVRSKNEGKIHLINGDLRNLVNEYHIKNLASNFNGKGVVTMEVSAELNDTLKIRISSILAIQDFNHFSPSWYLLLDSKVPILIATGIDKVIDMDSLSMIEIRKPSYAYLEKIPIPYNPPVWDVIFFKGRVLSLTVLN